MDLNTLSRIELELIVQAALDPAKLDGAFVHV
jgi:hypothetical protein